MSATGTRLDQLQENALYESLVELRRNIDELKQRQIVGGDNLLTYFVAGPDITANGIPPYADRSWDITFTPDSGQRTYNDIEVDLFITNGTGFEFYTRAPSPSHVNDQNSITWTLYFFNDANTTNVRFEIGFKALEKGTVTWQTA